MSDAKKTVKTLGKKSMKSVKGGGGLIIDRRGGGNLIAPIEDGVMVPEADVRKQGSEQQDY